MTTLQDRLDSFPEAWKPQVGEKLIGELTDVDMRESDFGDPYPILTIVDGDGREWAWHAFHTMARNQVARKRPQIGETVGISYHGKGKAAPGMNAPERWRFIVEGRNSVTVDWDAVATENVGEDAGDQTASTTGASSDADIPF